MGEPVSAAGAASAGIVALAPTGIVGVAVLLFGDNAGPFGAIAFCACAGAMWAMSQAKTPTFGAAALAIARLVMTSLVLTGPLAWYLEAQYHVPAQWAVCTAAFAIAFTGDRWQDWLGDIWARVKTKFLGGP